MLVRHTTDDTFECITQEHHALVSGLLASAWLPTRLPPLLVQVIGWHDNPWRPVDREPLYNTETGLPHDFVDYPKSEKIEFYQRGLDQMESVHPWMAYMISRHYTTFAGTRDLDDFNDSESERRERLAERIDDALIDYADEALDWIKFFDVWSLYLCMAGSETVEGTVPVWLRDPSDWATAPDETEIELSWTDDVTLELSPWPFARETVTLDLHLRRLPRRADDPGELEALWQAADREVRPLTIERRA
jgi:hypothetical protein